MLDDSPGTRVRQSRQHFQPMLSPSGPVHEREARQDRVSSPFADETQQQIRQAIEVMTAWVEGDEDGQRLALEVMATQLVEGGCSEQALL